LLEYINGIELFDAIREIGKQLNKFYYKLGLLGTYDA